MKDLRLRLHFQTLLEYDGMGRCEEVRCGGDIHGEQMEAWANRVNWNVSDNGHLIVMWKKK